MFLILSALIGYLIGSLCFGYYLVLWRKGIDIREIGSGVLGASNVERVLGKGGFVATAVLDIGKGSIAAWLGFKLAGDAGFYVASLFAVLGHLWPVFLRFKGGKGYAPAYGGLLYAHWLVALVVFCLVLLQRLTKLEKIIGGLLSLACPPLFYFVWQKNYEHAGWWGLCIALVIFGHFKGKASGKPDVG